VKFRNFGLLLTGVMGFLGAANGAQAEPAVRVAILPMVIHALEGHEYLRSGLADMLASRMGRVEGVSVIRADDSALATLDPGAARDQGRALGAQFVVYGSFTRFGEGASLDIHCVAVGGAVGDPAREVFIQSGTLGEIIPQIDGLAERVAHFVLSDGEDGEPPVAAAPPATGVAAGGGPNQLLFDEIDELRERVEALERDEVEIEQVSEEDVSEEELSRAPLLDVDDFTSDGLR
jgi:TolB-like protein